MADSVAKILEQLRGEESRLEKELDQTTSKLKASRAELKRVRSGIAALSGGKATSNGKPAPKKAEVRKAAVGVLKETGQLTEAEFEAAVTKRLEADGFGRAGLALRLKEVLASELVAVRDGAVRLAGSASETKSGTAT